MPQSPELAGGEGFTFEGDVAAFYLAALLAEAYAPGIDDRTVVRVSVQQRDFGEPLDDVIVDFNDSSKNPARLSLQVKRSLTISKAESNQDFRDIIRDSWATLKKSDFRINVDRYGAAVGRVSPAKEHALKTLCDWARESLMADHFEARFAKCGSASKYIKAVRNDIVPLLNATKGTPCTSQEVHQFLAHFVLIQFDFLRGGATDPPDAVERIRNCLVPDDADKASLVWSRLVQLARSSAGTSGQFHRARLVHSISTVARLRGAASFCHDLDQLTELAKSYTNLIPDDIGGTRLDRNPLLESLDTKLATARVVQVRGLPGSGKSVVVKRAVQRVLECGPCLFLKAEQLEGTNWISYATSKGISGAPLEQLLVEVGSAGDPILFIDAIDRIDKEHQPIIIDVIRAIVESQLLDNWRIVVSLRDTGTEVLRNWLGEFLDVLSVETLGVHQLNDEEAEILAKSKPHLRPLLFGSAQVREIVRRPFFAKVLHHSYATDSSRPTFTPQSEVDLIENWWSRGGYNESGQSSIERQRVLLELASVRSRQLSQPIGLNQLTSVNHIDDLIFDGILQIARKGISVRFAHDIFFEWAFFHVLADNGPKWLKVIKACGEPPAVARVVELASQWEYVQGTDWLTYLAQAEDSNLRSQWLRAWLIGPLGTAKFNVNEDQFTTAIFADDLRLFRKILVWFQAEKTSPNENILNSALPREQRQRFADLFSWPSDYFAWHRLISFTLGNISNIPKRFYPEIVAIFQVWQNALADYRNPISQALLKQCASWLAAIDEISTVNWTDENSAGWTEVPDVDSLRESLGQLLLRSSKAEPSFASDYLQRVTNSNRIEYDAFYNIIACLPILAQSLPEPVVEFTLNFLREELPEEQVAREEQQLHDRAEWRKLILAKPEAERTYEENMVISSAIFLRPVGDFSHYDWQRLSIHDDHRSFWPPSPLREPFHSLFQSSPNEALRLLRGLCNHAMTAWRQLHRHSRDHVGTPIPLELSFPWGTQIFWGTEREYLWFRSTWAPKAIGCGFMALEEWCFAELEHSRTVDELIFQIVEGNECIAILGIASMLALHTKTVSETTMPLFTSQRLLAADHDRMAQDTSSATNLMDFWSSTDNPHFEAIQKANARPVRNTRLDFVVPKLIFAQEPLCNRAREAILNFKNNLPYQYEEHRSIPEIREHLTAQALKYAELADPENYQICRTEENSDQIAIVHVSPSAVEPINVAEAEENAEFLRQMSLWTWASKSFEEETLNAAYTVQDAIQLAKTADTSDLFEYSNNENEEVRLGMRRGAVAATAAIALNFRDECTQENLEWARDVLDRAIRLPKKIYPAWSPTSVNSWHQGIFVARGLAADISEGTAVHSTALDLFGLIVHPLQVVSLTALEEACKLWPQDSKLTWAALLLAFSLCHIPSLHRDPPHHRGEALNTSSDVQAAVDTAVTFYENKSGWATLPLPPPAWVKIEPQNGLLGHQIHEDYKFNDVTAATKVWGEPNVFWHSKQAAEILQRIPVDEILNSSAKGELLDFLGSVLEWTNQKNTPPWIEPGSHERPATRKIELTRALGSLLGYVVGHIPLAEFQPRFLAPIFDLEGENCWSLLAPFTSKHICAYVYYAPEVQIDTVAILDLCLGRFLKDSVFERDNFRSGIFSDLNQPELVRTLMFVSVERDDLAVRYVNGDWSEISRILPLIDRFIRAGGWAASVMDPFLTLCERARDNYPAEVFADQVLLIISDDPDNLKGWHGTFIPARIAELVQYFAHSYAPMTPILAQNFLRILDILVDMGDRRSAAIQLGEAFRDIRLPS